MISVQNLTKYFGDKTVVDDVSFDVQQGETLVLLGTSGSGKTTTLRMINRLLEPSSGAILINNENILNKPPEMLRRSMGYVLQNYGLFPHYTVAENIAVVPKLLKWSPEKIEERIAELLQKLQLPSELLNAYPSQLSGGQKQRVGVARALAADPPVLLMDEPFGALDPITRADIKNQFLHLDELKNKTIIFVTHDVQEAFELGDRICLMDHGKVVQAGKPLELLLHPASPFVKQFFDHQRLQLELRSVAIDDVWDELLAADNGSNADLNSDENLWAAMELLTGNATVIHVKKMHTGEVKQLQLPDIQNALIKIKYR